MADKLINGNSLRIQFGNESAYGTPATLYPLQVKASDEGFKWIADKKGEGLLTGGKSEGKVATMSVKVEGSVTTLARPNEIEYFLAKCLGTESVETLDDVSTHTFTAIGNGLNDRLPSISANIDRTTEVDNYYGLKVNKISLDAAASDLVKANIEFFGQDENTSGTWATSTTVSPITAYRFQNGSVKLAGVVYEMTSIKFEYDNQLDNKVQTTLTGAHFREPDAGARKITCDFELVYSPMAETFRKNFYKTDAEFSVELNFVSLAEISTGNPYTLKIVLPACQAPEVSHNTSGADSQKMTLKCQAIENGVDELITITAENARATVY